MNIGYLLLKWSVCLLSFLVLIIFAVFLIVNFLSCSTLKGKGEGEILCIPGSVYVPELGLLCTRLRLLDTFVGTGHPQTWALIPLCCYRLRERL
jgi:hypothetical protein